MPLSDVMIPFFHPAGRCPAGKTLRVIAAASAPIYWRATGGAAGDVNSSETAFGLWFADLPTIALPPGAVIEFTLLCGEKKDGELHRVAIIEPAGTEKA